jgi:hypothetical protein
VATTTVNKNSVNHNPKVRENIVQLACYIYSPEPLRRKSILKGGVEDVVLSPWLVLTLVIAAVVIITGESSGDVGKHSDSYKTRSGAPNSRSGSMMSLVPSAKMDSYAAIRAWAPRGPYQGYP